QVERIENTQNKEPVHRHAQCFDSCAAPFLAVIRHHAVASRFCTRGNAKPAVLTLERHGILRDLESVGSRSRASLRLTPHLSHNVQKLTPPHKSRDRQRHQSWLRSWGCRQRTSVAM